MVGINNGNLGVQFTYELIGTFFLMLVVGMTIAPHSIGLFAPLAIGITLAILVYLGGAVSGGFYNPSVTAAVYLRGRLSANRLILYWLAEFLGAAIAAGVVIWMKLPYHAAMLHAHATTNPGGKPGLGVHASVQMPAASYTPPPFEIGKVFVIEMLFTFLLCWVVLQAVTDRVTKGNSWFGWAIGMVLAIGAYAAAGGGSGAITSAAFNPAVTFGLAITRNITWLQIWIYFLAQLVGSILAPILFLWYRNTQCQPNQNQGNGGKHCHHHGNQNNQNNNKGKGKDDDE